MRSPRPTPASAGALLAQTTQIASLDLFDFHRSADVMLMLVIGGAGYLYGGIIGAALFIVLRDVISAATPQYWEFWIGLLLVVLVLVGRERIARSFATRSRLAVQRRCERSAAMSAPALEARGLVQRFGGLIATDNVSFALAPGARQALIGPNGAGKTTLINLLTGVLKPSAGRRCCSRATTSRRSPATERVRRGLARTFQINQLFPDLTPARVDWRWPSPSAMAPARDFWRRRRHAAARSSTRSRSC